MYWEEDTQIPKKQMLAIARPNLDCQFRKVPESRVEGLGFRVGCGLV